MPNPAASTPERTGTTVAPQALFLMNSPFLVEQARALMQLPELATEASAEKKIHSLYRRVLGRNPEAEEVSAGVEFVNAARPEPGMQVTPWESYAQVLLLTNEFAFVD